jgi:hypothetical protein
MLAEMTIRDHRDYGDRIFGSLGLGLSVLMNIAFGDMFHAQAANFYGVFIFAIMVLVFNLFFGFFGSAAFRVGPFLA